MVAENEKSEADIKLENELNPNNVTKYQTAAEIVNKSMTAVIAAAVEGAKIVDLCALGDGLIVDEAKKVFNKGNVAKGIAFPTCCSPNGILCHFSPMKDDPEGDIVLKNGDVLRIEMGAHVDGFISQLAHTVVVGASKETPVTGRQADALRAVHTVCEAVLRKLKPGNTNSDVTKIIKDVALQFDCIPIEGMLSHQLQKNTLDGPKQIIQNPPEGQGIKEIKFEEGEAYAINLLVSTGEGKSRLRNTKTTVYSKNPGVNYMLKLKTSRAVLSEITTKFGNMAFSLQHMEDPKKARMGISECQTHQLVQNYDVLEEKAEGAIVAHCLFTVLLMPSGPLKITSGPAFDADIVKSEKAIADESIIDLLKQSVRSTNKKKKKKAAAGGGDDGKDGE